ncbi:hypothetical protein SDC9_118479 [bioreactor metagenome]|uniref:Uncharacterized protein n=1 Tax=bioreactor metagenome TaxID=1076179 RepID=A0A645C8Y3_9ZZZZ
MDSSAKFLDFRHGKVTIKGCGKIPGRGDEARFEHPGNAGAGQLKKPVADDPAGGGKTGAFVAHAGDGDRSGTDLRVAIVVAIAEMQ